MPAHVLVTGAAGLIGTAVLDLLAAQGITSTALVLESDQTRASRTLVADARDTGSVADALDGADAVIHLAAIPRPGHDPDEVVFGRNTQATFTVFDQAARRGDRLAAQAELFARFTARYPFAAG
ncbi:NAD-dependent epimerase/dehydratase family protein [Actinoplanes bogorensis]|uniref:NAD-dependent epimerase/dehydratase family protein n=1 Tax=Paractinoplanes bogorensis TaxID=1610840 RepID=A0ABS5YT17_9ACTN|nr:NAD-dependent epimerase/dehydratase family protein [Actinoplanes bogorensis]MBU2666597.1 NAD-dependent epimerase/dehydratase family protein [Actinoplanes bogorensis]